MRRPLTTLLLLAPLLGLSLLTGGCAEPAPEQTTMKYPKMPADDSERKSGPAMLFYEAAEEAADPSTNVIVTPPPEKKDEQ